MQHSNIQKPSNTLLIAGIAAFTLALAGSAYIIQYIGTFATVTVEKIQSPNYYFAYLSHTGPYNQLQGRFDEVDKTLKSLSVQPVSRAAVFLDDPSVVPENQLRSKIGVIVNEADFPVAGLESEEITSRLVARTLFDGSPVIGSYKSYTAIKEWSKSTGATITLPAFEIYHSDGVTEYQLPLAAK